MKQITLLALLVVPLMQSLSAQDNSLYNRSHSGRRVKDHDYFEIKAQRTKSAAWIMVTAGAALVIGGELIYNSSNHDFENFDDDIGAATAGAAGVLLISGSVPLFITAAHYSKRATETSLSLDLQKGPLEMRPSMTTGYFPAVSIKFSF